MDEQPVEKQEAATLIGERTVTPLAYREGREPVRIQLVRERAVVDFHLVRVYEDGTSEVVQELQEEIGSLDEAYVILSRRRETDAGRPQWDIWTDNIAAYLAAQQPAPEAP